MKLLHPLPGGRQTDRYGPRAAIPGVIGAQPHLGNDWAAPSGTPIRAATGGTVWRNYFDKLGGWMVILKHSWGYTSYQHMRAKAKLSLGHYVAAGQHIGNVGSSGASTGPHLHFEVWLDGTPYGTGRSIDPLTVIGTPAKGTKVSHKNFQNREANRKLKPGQTLYLVNSRGAKQDVAPDVGTNLVMPHVHVRGLAPGDTVKVVLEWDDRKGKISSHYDHTQVADIDGNIFMNASFVRGVAWGWFVHVRVIASRHNKKTGTVAWIDCDTVNLGA